MIVQDASMNMVNRNLVATVSDASVKSGLGGANFRIQSSNSHELS